MKKVLLTLAFVLTIFVTGFAQKSYTWNQKVEITVVDGMTVQESTDNYVVVGNDNVAIEIIPYEDDELADMTSEDYEEAFEDMADEIGADLSQAETMEFQCKNGEGRFIVAPIKDKDNVMGLLAIAGSKTSSNLGICAAGVMTESEAEKAGQILGGITFKK